MITKEENKIPYYDNIGDNILGANVPFYTDIDILADKIQCQLKNKKNEGCSLLPFDEIVYCNIGNPQLYQKPLTFIRQVVSIVEYPDILSAPSVESIFPKDVIDRAKTLIRDVNTGTYSHPFGSLTIRKNIAQYIEKRDGYPCDHEKVIISDGTSRAIRDTLRFLINSKSDGIMTPTPQFPLYEYATQIYKGSEIPYFLKEEEDWKLDISELENSFNNAIENGIRPRCLVVINPGNPTGQILEESNIREILLFCHRHSIILIADEVYQSNIFTSEKPFISFKKVMCSMGDQLTGLGLISYHSASKGPVGECGKRGGYMEIHGFHDKVFKQFCKVVIMSMCGNLVGQVIMDLVVRPPVEGDPSYELYLKEKSLIIEQMKFRADLIYETLCSMEGVTCNKPYGSMYMFPRIRLPERAINQAKELGLHPDNFYSQELLKKKGIYVTPGSLYKQREGTYHLRITFLVPRVEYICENIKEFHKSFMEKYK